MTQARVRALMRGLSSFVPVVRRYTCRASGGTDSARYCYAVWMRHLIKAGGADLSTNPGVVAEIGPGDSIGVGIAALLTGARQYYALDAKPHLNIKLTLSIFDDLVELLRGRAPIPDSREFPNIQPSLASYEFPEAMLPAARMGWCLEPARIDRLRSEIGNLAAGTSSVIQYAAPWEDRDVIAESTVDMAVSQAVLEHVVDIRRTYAALSRWLRPGGVTSHSIDFKSHGLTRDWYGHWTLPDWQWRLLFGSRPYLLNRASASEHVAAMRAAGFDIVHMEPRRASRAPREGLNKRFWHLTEDDLESAGLFVQAVRQR